MVAKPGVPKTEREWGHFLDAVGAVIGTTRRQLRAEIQAGDDRVRAELGLPTKAEKPRPRVKIPWLSSRL